MTATRAEPVASPADAAAVFDWRRCWYPVGFVQDLPRDRPYGFRIHDLSLVLFRDGDGRLRCLADRCPHRAARLSDGRLEGGRIECGYHGWQFDGGGRCVQVPQLACGAEIPARARVASHAVVERQGIAWVWPGDPDDAAESEIPTVPALDRTDVVAIDFMIDLPYAQSYLVENVIDIAHIHFAHDGIRGGGRRELAGPLAFEVTESTARGFRCSFAPAGDASAREPSSLRAARVTFAAPNLVWYESDYRDERRVSGLALYSLPLGASRCRLVYRAYSNFWPWRERWKPRALHHWTQCRILEQDMQLVIGQAEEIDASGRELRDLWLPLQTSDALVLAYRKWLDTHGASIPNRRGFTTSSAAAPREASGALDRHTLHTANCSACTRGHRWTKRAAAALAAAAFVLLAISIVARGTALTAPAAACSVAALFGAIAARSARTRFE